VIATRGRPAVAADLPWRARGTVAAATAAAALVAALLAALALGMVPPPAAASPYIDIRISVKVIKNPSTGGRPEVSAGVPMTNDDVYDMVADANDSLLASYGRGYRFVVSEIVDIGTTCTTCSSTNPSFWFDEPYLDGTNRMEMFENTAIANPTAFAWRTDKINLYFNKGKGNGAVSSFPNNPNGSDHVVLAGGTVFTTSFRDAFAGALLHHELGHYFNLLHTHNSQPGCPDSTATLCSNCGGGDDEVNDTLMDRACRGVQASYPLPGWEWMDIALKNYGTSWGNYDWQREAVDNTYFNNMSYHNGGFSYGHFVLYRMTEGQLDRWADTANGVRNPVCSGKTWFVSTTGGLFASGSSTDPYVLPALGVGAANAGGGDIVLMRPGVYPQVLTVNKPVTLRVARGGTARIGN